MMPNLPGFPPRPDRPPRGRRATIVLLLALASGVVSRAATPVFRFCDARPASSQDHTAWRHATAALRPPSGVDPVDTEPTRKLGIQKLLFLRVRYPDDRADPISEAEAIATLAEVHQHFQRISHGRYGIAGTVSPVLPLPRPRTDYDFPGGFDLLIADSRQAGVDAGFDYRHYDLEVVRHSGVPSFAGGNARLGVRGAQVQIGGAGILLHELGHNLGLSHANFWETSGPGIVAESPPMPSNLPTLPDPRSIRLHPDSVIGHDTVTGPGQTIEYGDPWDIMGTGGSEFGGGYKVYLGWLPNDAVTNAPPGRSSVRLVDPEAAGATPGALRLLRIATAFETPLGTRTYSAELPPPRLGLPPDAGLLLRWNDHSTPPLGSQLIDATPGTDLVNSDAFLRPGSTFSDLHAGVHVTLVALGTNDAGVRWADVIVVRGSSATNQAPELTLATSATEASSHTPVTLTAQVQDVDADDLVLAWDFGDGTTHSTAGAGTHTVQHIWKGDADVTVRVVASDLRGGRAFAQQTLRIGTPATLRLRGTLRTPEGTPIADARVHNGVESHGRPGDGLSQARTDSQGRFTLIGLTAERQAVAAFHPDFRIERIPPVDLAETDRDEIELVGHPLPRVAVEAPSRVAESAGYTNLFVLKRSGPLDQPLTVTYRLTGTAAGGSDYVRPLLDRVTFAPGAATVALALDLLNDSVGEGSEQITLVVASPSRFTSPDASGQLITTFYPGWEAIPYEGNWAWSRTRPSYLPEGTAEASVEIIDDDAIQAQTVAVTEPGIIAFESPQVDSEFRISRSGKTDEALTLEFQWLGTAIAGLDFEPLPESLVFAPGETLLVVPVRPLPDALPEAEETLTLRLLPGAAYGVEQDTATVRLQDTPNYPQTLALARQAEGQLLVTLRGAPGGTLVLEASANLIDWTPLRTNRLFNSDTATLLLPSTGDQRYLRTRRP